MKIAVVSPHRDDAAFSLSLTIDAWAVQGLSVTVVNCFTRSVYAPFSDAGSLHPNDRLSYVTALRAREDTAWRRHHGPNVAIHNLNLKDAPLRLKCTNDEVCGLEIDYDSRSLRKIQRELTGAGADCLVLPLGIGRHVDHRAVHDAAVSILTLSTPCAFYEDLPYAARPGAAAQIDERVGELDLNLSPGFVCGPSESKEAVARKRRAVLCYDSQIDDETADVIALFSTRYAGRERLWVNGMWRRTMPMAEDMAVAS